MTISAEGLITDVNRAAELVTGVAREQLIGSDFSVCFTEPEQAASVNQEVLAQGIVRDYPLTIRHTSGRTTDVLYNAIVHQSEHGEALSVFAAARDITERKKAEVELKKLNVSLEQRADQLRRLASDLTQAEEVERRRLSQLLHDHLQQLLVAAKLRLTIAFNLSAQHAEELRGTIQEVQTLLDQSVAASRTLTAELSPPILYDSGLAPALAWLSRWMEEKYGLQVQLDGDPEADPGTQELRILLFRSARELLFNVVKHAGVERAQVTLQRLIDGRIQLHVADEGAGFDQVDRLSPEKAGFGLLSVRERMELMGGTFAVDSSPGCGTRITLTISPIIITAKAEKVALVREEITLPPSIAADGERQAIRVLIADDHAVVRQGLAALLGSQADMQVVGEAGDGRAAVNLAREQSPDVVVMDVNMPLLDGVEATRIIAAELPRIKVIGLSVHAKQDMETRMREAGAVAYLDKSGPAEDLLDAIRKSVS